MNCNYAEVNETITLPVLPLHQNSRQFVNKQIFSTEKKVATVQSIPGKQISMSADIQRTNQLRHGLTVSIDGKKN